MKKSRKAITGKDRFLAKLSFWLSLGFWIPLFNIGFAIASLVISIKAINRILKDNRFGGLTFAIIGLIISAATIIGSLIFFTVYMYRRVTCDTISSLF